LIGYGLENVQRHSFEMIAGRPKTLSDMNLCGSSEGEEAIAIPLNADAIRVLIKRIEAHQKFVFSYKGSCLEKESTAAWYKALKRAGLQDFDGMTYVIHGRAGMFRGERRCT